MIEMSLQIANVYVSLHIIFLDGSVCYFHVLLVN